MQEIQVGEGRAKAGKGGRVFFVLFHLFQDTQLRLLLWEGQVPLGRTMPGGSGPSVCDL